MPFDAKPSTWLGAGYAVAGSKLQLNTASNAGAKAIPQVTDAEADPTTGDIRKVSYGLAEMLWQAWIAQQAALALPARMSMSRSSSVDATSGIITTSYAFTFQNEITAQDVAPEPA